MAHVPSERRPYGPDVPVQMGDVIDGRYRVDALLGRGSMGVVLSVLHLELHERRALKLMLPSAIGNWDWVERFLREGRAVVRLKGRHVAHVHDVGRLPSGLPFLVMDYLEGQDLKSVLEARQVFSVAEAVEITRHVCAGLAEAHALGIVHRDIKPANLFITRGESGEACVKILDFGVAKVTGALAGAPTGSAYVIGTPSYMAPEQMRSARDVDARADLWSVGVLLYRMLSGRVPFPGGAMEVAGAIMAETAPPPIGRPDLPAGLEDVVFDCLQYDVRRRVAGAIELANRLAPFASGGLTAQAVSPATSASLRGAVGVAARGRRGRRALPWLLAGSLLVGAGTAAVVVRPARTALPDTSEPSAPPTVTAEPSSSAAVAAVVVDAERLASFAALPKAVAPSPSQEPLVGLGKALFSDPALSKNGDIACASCHRADHFLADTTPLSVGSDGKSPPRNTLSLYNAAGFFALSWDGRQATLFDQAKEVLLSPLAMGATKELVRHKLKAAPTYQSQFARAFPGQSDPITFDNTARALAAYEATLVSRGPWDRYLEGDSAALDDTEKAGFNRFVDVGCVTCHFGPHVGATMFQKAGLVKAWPNTADQGRVAITKNPADVMVFRVPSLRNVARTAPYFHDGSVDSLEVAISKMGWHQLGRELSPEDVRLIAAWLACLTGDELPAL